MESQLFGHLKGAFSGATRDETGFVRSANYGTLFLDEIGDLPANSQAALLRVLQEGEVTPVGSSKPTKVDVRVVCATHRPLEELMEEGTFRRDLYARLAGFVHSLPPLRERREDIGLIVAAILRGSKVQGGTEVRFRPEAARALLRYDWPLNVRELEQCLATSAVLAEKGLIAVEDLPPTVARWATAKPEDEGEGPSSEDEALRRELVQHLEATGGNVSEVARAMGKARQQVQRWLRRFGIDPEKYRRE
jgi:DNA-binding NtrC family response regulator